jgi:inosine-uridine nucleoside N-ribohydrolase
MMPGDKRRPIYIDCDPGLDDAVAIALAAAARELDIAAVTTAAGNTTIDRVTDNALSLCATLGLKTPVYAGAGGPLRGKAHYGTEIWGGDGSLGLKRPRRGAVSEPAADFLCRALKEAEDHSVLMCCLAPLTNLALVLSREPRLAEKIDRLMLMGGALGKGNATAAAEFNVWFDPHAAKRVLDTEVPTVVVPYDLTRTVTVTRSQIRRLAKSEKPGPRFAARMLALAGEDGHPAAIHDAVVIGCLLWPDLFSFEPGRMNVGVEDGPARGQTRFKPGDGHHIVLTSVQHEKLLNMMIGKLLGRTDKRQ